MIRAERFGMVVILLGACSPHVTQADRDGGNLVADDGGLIDYPDAEVCASVKVDLAHTTPTMALLVDQSDSMGTSFSNTTRWNALYDTLMNSTNGVVKQLQGSIRFGLYMFTDSFSTCPKMTVVKPALNNYTAINNVYGPAGPSGNTPTAEAVTYTKSALTAITDPGSKIIVLATDGEPNGCGFGVGGTSAELTAVQQAYQAGIRTYVIGVSSDIAGTDLQQVANVGQGKAANATPGVTFWQANDQATIVTAFNSIVSTVQSCSYTLDGKIDPTQAGDGTVTLDGQPLTYGVDWTVESDGKTLDLLGGVCDSVKAGNGHDIEAQFPCEVVVGRRK